MILSELGERQETFDVNRALHAIRKSVARGRAASASTLQKSGAAPAARRACCVQRRGKRLGYCDWHSPPRAARCRFQENIILDYYSELLLLDYIVLDRVHTCRLTNFQTPST
jgi:hypothetical protein